MQALQNCNSEKKLREFYNGTLPRKSWENLGIYDPESVRKCY